jgi:hypothetical protein
VSDVTCKAVESCFELCQAHGVAASALAATTPYSLAFLRDKDNRIPWADFVAINRATRVGRAVFKKGPLRLVMSLARVLGEPARFYQWMQRGNRMLFANMSSRVVTHNPHQLSIHIRLRDDDAPCPEYLLISKGAIATMPTLLGYPEASVHLRRRDPEAIFDVTMQPKRPSFVRQALRAVTGRYETAEELLATNEQLIRRFEELQLAHTRIQEQAALVDRQARRLQLAHEISQLIHGTFDLQDTLDTIARTLLSHTEATAARIAVRLEVAGAVVAAEASSGDPDQGEHVRAVPLAIRGVDVGVLTLSAPSEPAQEELAGSLEYVLPVLAMAIENARVYRELATYQRGLERLVEERTAELRRPRCP